MKKYLTLLMLAFMTVAAFAAQLGQRAGETGQLFIMGGEPLAGWGVTQEMTLNDATQAFECTLESANNMYFTFGDAAFSDWDDWNANHRYAIAAGDQNAEVGQEYQLVKANGTIVLSSGKYLVSVTTDLRCTITLIEEVAPETPETYAIVGDFTGGWEADAQMTRSADNASVYTLFVEGFEAEAKTYEYKLRANGKWGVYDLPADDSNNNFVFGTEEYPAGKYNLTFTANVTENTLTLDAELVQETELNTYSATFDNTSANWEKVYAYVWTGEGQGEVLGQWPGTEMQQAGDGSATYSIQFKAAAAPEFIIFHNGEGTQTGNLTFENEKTYTYVIPATNIEITVEEGGDIAEALNAAKAQVAKVGQIIINLKEAQYTVSSTLEAPATLYINGNGATIDASALSGAFIKMSATPSVELVNDYYRIEGIGINDLTLNGLKGSIFHDNNVKYCAVGFYISNCVMQLATESVNNEALIAFQGGGAKDFYVTNSTIYGNAGVAKYFVRYNNSARLDRYGYDKDTEFETVNYQKNTFYNLLNSEGQWANYSGMAGQKYTAFDVKNNIWMNCGENLIARRLLGGRAASSYTNCTFENNTYAHVDAESGEVVFETEGTVGTDEETGEATNVGTYDVSGTALTTDPKFRDAANGDFAVEASTAQALYETGDQRWGTWAAPVAANYYLVGNMNGWEISDDYKLTLNDKAETEEYMITIELEADAQFKIARPDGESVTYYPDGTGNAYGENGEVTAAGSHTVYFRPNADGGDDWFHGVILAQHNADGISLVTDTIQRTAEVYNLSGQRVTSPRKGLYVVNGRKVAMK